ncbi:MAG: hypothetical protein J5728_10905 [Lachnospiraceae bacterium]|nr:hypothetical protein [Lachnospiraceae bacterium]
MKRILSILLVIIFLLSPGITVSAKTTYDDISKNSLSKYSQELASAYIELSQFIADNDLPASISIEAFEQEYLKGKYHSVSEYLNSFYSLFEVDSASKWTNDTKWYYNTGVTLMDKPVYNNYNLLSVVQAGDIIFEASGSSGISGHIAIVEGIYYDTSYATFYIRIIEAIGYLGSVGEGDGVCRGVLDDNRYQERQGTVLRVSTATSSQKASAVSFCIGQIGKGYWLDLLDGPDTSEYENDWYCSELVWAAYKNQGIDLETTNNSPGITPKEIRDSSLTDTQTVSTIGTPAITSITVNSPTTVRLNWSVVNGASYYYVYRSSSISSNTYSLVAITPYTSFTNSNLTAGSTYYYRISAETTALGNKSQPEGVKLSFSAPVIIKSCPVGSTSVALSWCKVYNAIGYYVYRSTSASGTYTKVSATTGTSYSDYGLASGTTYYYKVVAHNSSSSTGKSSYKSVIPTTCQKPTIYWGSGIDIDSLAIKWTNVPNATSYYVYRATSASGTYTKIATVDKTSYTNTGLSMGTYYYKIVAYNSSTGQTSHYSDYKEVSTMMSAKGNVCD